MIRLYLLVYLYIFYTYYPLSRKLQCLHNSISFQSRFMYFYVNFTRYFSIHKPAIFCKYSFYDIYKCYDCVHSSQKEALCSFLPYYLIIFLICIPCWMWGQILMWSTAQPGSEEGMPACILWTASPKMRYC